MTGRLQEKNGNWYLILNTYDSTGKRKLKWISTGLPVKGNKKRAEKLLQDAIREHDQQEGLATSDITFADYIRVWLQYVQRKVDSVTYQGYLALANVHLLPYFDGKGNKLQELTREQIQAYIDEKAHNGRCDGKGGLSYSSMKLHKNIINQTCNLAVQKKLLFKSPCEFILLPQAKKLEYSFYTSEQMQQLFEVTKNDPMHNLIRITALYGLRRSEVLGIKWNSINFDSDMLTIKHTVCKVTTVVEKDKTKNASSHRSFPLLPEAKAVFERIKVEQEQNAQVFGQDYHKSDYVFTWNDGRPFSPDYVSQHFAHLLKKHELPHIRFHELRHSCASILISMGFTLKDIQEWLGHSDIKMTANIYSHLDVERKKSMAERLSEKLA
ncbi:MAG: site-specific integrase [Clostridiales bacterium]|nr:site-specific integrase [Clostridiales bacterium]